MKHPKGYDTTPETRARMSIVKLKGGDAERALAKELWHRGLRYRKNDRRLPGSPDIAILRHHIAVFVDGEFWHGKDWDTRKDRLRRNREYWTEKIEENIARDARVEGALRGMGWTPVRFWARDVERDVGACVAEILDIIADA